MLYIPQATRKIQIFNLSNITWKFRDEVYEALCRERLAMRYKLGETLHKNIRKRNDT